MLYRIITIDGPAGAGKTTVSKLLAKKLGCVRVDTGALYRGVAHEIKKQKIMWQDDAALKAFLSRLDLTFVLKKEEFRLISSGKDITPHIRTPEITMLASVTSARPAVRSALLDLQRRIASQQDAVFEGRDMGTVVFPDAKVKFFLFADLEVRARRRYEEMPDPAKDLFQVQAEMAARDTNDAQRVQAPLKPAPDAIHIDSSHLTARQVVDEMLRHL
ncbi:MAG: (d)CMP kinase [Desulfotignum sp.]|nr:(d)CMP kinase [Desulfotignum sp.]MCF8112522.1 (d)CMP kinase [Desulfotignum sp.]MCF8124728.1 (d)CMP kinase [Desulfotignum sp.]